MREGNSMKNNPLIPYVLIVVFGIGLIFFMSFMGAADKNSADENHGSTAEISGEEVAQKNCISCHGGDLQGQGTTPAITGLDAEHIKEVALNGQGNMPAILKSDAEAQAVAEYISGL